MRKNTREIYEAWKAGKAKKAKGCNGSPVSTDGQTIFSYNVPVVRRQGERVFFNVGKYSRTTSCHQNGLRMLLSWDGVGYENEDCNS